MLSEWGNKMRHVLAFICEFTIILLQKKKLHFCFKLPVKNVHGNHSAGFSSIFRVTNPIRHIGAQNLKLKKPHIFQAIIFYPDPIFFFKFFRRHQFLLFT